MKIKDTIIKYLIFVFILEPIFPFLFPHLALAQVNLGIEYGENIGLSNKDPRDIAVDIIQVLLGFMAIIVVVLILYAGFTWMLSAGNEDRVAIAKGMLTSAIIGLFVILSAWGISSFVVGTIFNATIQ